MPTKIDKYKLPRKHDRRYKVSEEDEAQMRELYHCGMSQKDIADIFGISQSSVSYIVSDYSKNNLIEYRKRNPSKKRTKEEAREYARTVRAYKKELIERNKNAEE